MWRSLFLAMGVYLVLLGAQCLGVEKFTLKPKQPASQSASLGDARAGAGKEIVPPPWAPWSLMSTGAVVCLYSFTIPSRLKS